MPIPLSYHVSNASRSRRIKRVAITTVASSVIGGLMAAVSLIALHPHPLEALPASPVFLICLLRGGGDWEAITFIWIGGFVLYALYGLVSALPSQVRHRVAVGIICSAIHVAAALLCEMSRRGLL
jgi:hypothetical protein